MRNRAVIAIIGLAGLLSLGFDSTDHVQTQTDFYMSNSGTGCPGTPYLGTTPGSGEPGCGYQGGAPFGELHHAGVVADTVNHYSTPSAPTLILDASRSIDGKNRIVATSTTNRIAAGQVRVDTTVRATFVGGGSATIGTHSVTIDWIPGVTAGETDIPFTMDVPDTHDGKVIASLTADVDIRGVHVLTGYHRLNGESRFTLPTWTPLEAPPGAEG